MVDRAVGVSKRDSQREIIWDRVLKPRNLWGMYNTESWVAAGIDEIAKWVIALGWEVRAKVKNPSLDQKDELLEFLENPNPEDTLEDLFVDEVVDWHVLGDSLQEKVRDEATGQLLELWSLDTNGMRILTDENKMITGYIQEMKGVKDPPRWGIEDIFRLKRNAQGRTLFGASILRPLFLPVTTGIFGQAWNRNRFENMGAGRKIYIMDEDMGKEQVLFNDARLKELKGTENAGADVLLWGGVKVESGDQTPQDMEWGKQLSDTCQRILAVLGVPPEVVGLIEGGGLAGQRGESQIKKFKLGTINPMKRRIENKWNKDLILGEMGITDWVLHIRRPDPAEDKERAETSQIYVEMGAFTIDEVRADLGRKPLDDLVGGEPEGDQKDAPETITTKDVDSRTGLEINPAPLIPNLQPAVVKMKAGILMVMRKWRSRVLFRFDRMTKPIKHQPIGLLPLMKYMFDKKAAAESFAKAEINPDLFLGDIANEDMAVVLAAGMGTAARAGQINAVRLGGAQTDEAAARVRPFIQVQSSKLAGEIAQGFRSSVADGIIEGVQQGLPIREIRKNIEDAFDKPKKVRVASSVRSDGTAVVAHTRTITADKWAEMVARTESSVMASESALQSFAAADVEKVTWRTAKFRVDQIICMPQDGKVFLLSDVQGKKLIPAHPHCRCAFLPAKKGDEVTGDPTNFEEGGIE